MSEGRIFPILDREPLIQRDKPEHDLTDRTHSYRNYRPQDFVEYPIEDGKFIADKYIDARKVFRRMESGRFHDMMDKTSRFFASLDPDEKRMWANRNPDMMEWIGTFGYIEELNTFEEYSNIPSVIKTQRKLEIVHRER